MTQKRSASDPTSAAARPNTIRPPVTAVVEPGRVKTVTPGIVILPRKPRASPKKATPPAVVDSLRNPGTLWVIVAAGERQARESLSKAKEWAETLRFQIAHYNEERVSPAARMPWA